MASVPTSGKSQAGAVPPTATAVDDAKESTTLRFEWTVRGLKNLFEGRLVIDQTHKHKNSHDRCVAKGKPSQKSSSPQDLVTDDGKSVQV